MIDLPNAHPPSESPSMSNVPSRSSAGFTMIEFILVVAITGILIVGLGAVVDIPSRVATNELAGDARISDLDRTLKWLDDDVRFAADVAAPSLGELEITRRDGQVVRYTWGGASGPLVREAPEGTAELIRSAARVQFTLGMSDVTAGFDPGSSTDVVVEAAGFDSFTLLPGFGLSGLLGLGSLLIPVDLLEGALPVTKTDFAGLAFTVSGLAGEGYVESVRVRLRKSGSQNLRVRLYEADPATNQPTNLLLNEVVHKNSLPAAMSDFTIPLSADFTVANGDRLFLELSCTGGGGTVDVAYQTLSIAAAAAAAGSTFLSSSGGSFLPLAGSPDASQTVFSVTVREIDAVSGGGAGGTVQIPTSVHAMLQLVTSDGVSTHRASVPVANNLARVNR